MLRRRIPVTQELPRSSRVRATACGGCGANVDKPRMDANRTAVARPHERRQVCGAIRTRSLDPLRRDFSWVPYTRGACFCARGRVRGGARRTRRPEDDSSTKSA